MALVVTPAQVISVGGLSPELFNLPDRTSLDAFVQDAINFSQAWMMGHMGSNFGLTTPSWAVTLQQKGCAYLALEYITDTLKAQRVYGTHSVYISEDSPEYQALIDLNWGERALVALDLWVTVEVGAARAFALPLLVEASGMNSDDKTEDQTFPGISEQYSDQLDWARGLVDSDIGVIRR